MAVVGPTDSAVLALAVLRAINAISPGWTSGLTRVANPSGQALASTCNMMALCPIFTVASIGAVQPVTLVGARMLASKANVAWSTDVLATYMIARYVSCKKKKIIERMS